MHKIPARTVFAGQNLVYVPQCHSTNTLAANLGQRSDTPEGTVVITDNQTAGRGQRGNTWESEPGKNLTFSLILYPSFLAAKDQFRLSQAISLGIAAFVAQQVPQQVKIKWPNDILVAGKKIAGILIENHLTGDTIGFSVVGVGLNVNQQKFGDIRAGSLGMITGTLYNLDEAFEELLIQLEQNYLALKEGRFKELESLYLKNLFGKDEPRRFSDGQSSFEGTIAGVTEQGQLRINISGRERTFGVKEITFL